MCWALFVPCSRGYCAIIAYTSYPDKIFFTTSPGLYLFSVAYTPFVFPDTLARCLHRPPSLQTPHKEELRKNLPRLKYHLTSICPPTSSFATEAGLFAINTASILLSRCCLSHSALLRKRLFKCSVIFVFVSPEPTAPHLQSVCGVHLSMTQRHGINIYAHNKVCPISTLPISVYPLAACSACVAGHWV